MLSKGTLVKTSAFADTNPDAFSSFFSSAGTASIDGFGPGDYSAGYTGDGDRVYWGPSDGSEIVKPPAAVSRTHPKLQQDVSPPHFGPGFGVQAAHGTLATTDSGGFTIEGTGIETTFRPIPKPSAPQPSARTGAVAPPGSEATAPASSVGAQASTAATTTDASNVSFMGSHSEPGTSAGWGERSNMSNPDARARNAAATEAMNKMKAEFDATVAQNKAAAIELQTWKAGRSTATTTTASTASTVTTAPSEDVIAGSRGGSIELQPLQRGTRQSTFLDQKRPPPHTAATRSLGRNPAVTGAPARLSQRYQAPILAVVTSGGMNPRRHRQPILAVVMWVLSPRRQNRSTAATATTAASLPPTAWRRRPRNTSDLKLVRLLQTLRCNRTAVVYIAPKRIWDPHIWMMRPLRQTR